LKREEIAEAKRILALSSPPAKADTLIPVKLPSALVSWIQKHQGAVSTYIRAVLIEELKEIANGK
jgi:hypothetical protein